MPKLAEESVPIVEGNVVLYRRTHSAAWQARYKAGGRWVRRSTKCKDLEEAKEKATDFYMEARYREKIGVPAVSRRFRAVAELAKKRMQEALDANQGKAVFVDYIQVINNYLIPFFGNRNVDNIDYEAMQKYAQWRKEKMGREPKSSTVNTHNAAINRVFDEALERGFMTQSQIPTLKNKGADGERRPDFTLDEYRQLYRYMRTWVNAGKKGKTTDMRYLLRDYVLILANTGMRHGTESYTLKWKNLRLIRGEDDRQYLLISVNGKTGQRELVARSNAIRYFKRIYERAEDLQEYDSFEALLKAGPDKLVFRLPDGTATQNLNRTFDILLKDSGLTLDRRTEQKRSLYSLRHTYASFALIYNDIPIPTLAKQMGTSIAMIEKHYSHLEPTHHKEQLAGFERLVETTL